ncbi:hypothetical protein AO372_0004 [Moraxella catarrhalis]|nr:hypothetical protein AO372_0004 [Moraxella catarrhalis]
MYLIRKTKLVIGIDMMLGIILMLALVYIKWLAKTVSLIQRHI